MIMRLDSFSKQILIILVYFVLYQSFRRAAMLKTANSQHYPPVPFAIFIGSLMRL